MVPHPTSPRETTAYLASPRRWCPSSWPDAAKSTPPTTPRTAPQTANTETAPTIACVTDTAQLTPRPTPRTPPPPTITETAPTIICITDTPQVEITETVPTILCIKECGCQAAPGFDRNGWPFNTCCRACAKGFDYHDDTCGCPVPSRSQWSRRGEPPTSSQQSRHGNRVPSSSQRSRNGETNGYVGEALDGVHVSIHPTLMGREDGREARNKPCLCVMGCGMPVAPGLDKNGNAFVTCCMGCAQGQGHDGRCRRNMMIQSLELERYGRMKAARDQFMEAARYVWDPVWGEIELKDAGTDRKRVRLQMVTHCGFMMCPCLMVTCGCCKNEIKSGLSPIEKRRAWRRLFLSCSMFFSLVQIITLVYPLMMWGGFVSFEKNSSIGPALYVLDSMAAKNTAKILHGQWWRLFCPIMLHAGLTHIFANIFIQLRTGLVLEILWGKPIWLSIYWISGIYANIASCIIHPNAIGVGASGALCGLIGAWLPFIVITWSQTMPKDEKLRNGQLTVVVCAIVILIPTSFMPGVDTAAHFGGLMCGALMSCMLFASRLQNQRQKLMTGIVGFVTFLALMVLSVSWLLTQTQYNESLLRLCTPEECQDKNL